MPRLLRSKLKQRVGIICCLEARQAEALRQRSLNELGVAWTMDLLFDDKAVQNAIVVIGGCTYAREG